jgi:hypothetical protein
MLEYTCLVKFILLSLIGYMDVRAELMDVSA